MAAEVKLELPGSASRTLRARAALAAPARLLVVIAGSECPWFTGDANRNRLTRCLASANLKSGSMFVEKEARQLGGPDFREEAL
jgi:hypothetical protein